MDKELSDRELLKLAAKAAGMDYEVDPWFFREPGDIWNPLTGDGDALRLVVKLRMYVGPRSVSHIECWCGAGPGSLTKQPYGDDPYAATRRAIVRCAAEIGKGVA